MPPAISVITLLTDFGDRDYFVASMKGVILGINPQARIVDLSHHVPPQQIGAAAYLLKAAYHYFPDGTIHVAVVDPGVGTSRRPLIVSTSRYHFVAPDNGLLSHIYQDEFSVEVRQIENRQYRLESEGTTFDGRDVFAPAAAWLTRGQQPGSFGRLVQDYVRLPIPEPRVEAKVLTGQIVYVDHYGNLISNVGRFHLKELQGATRQSSVSVRVAGVTIEGLSGSYADGPKDGPGALINSNGQVEIFVRGGSAADLLKSGPNDPLQIL